MEKAERTMRETIRCHALLDGVTDVVIGLSGGPDSLCMFDIFCKIAAERGLRLHPVHVNHGLRPGAAEADQAFVVALCQARGWPCTTCVTDCRRLAAENGWSEEEAGRRARYAAFAAEAARIRSHKAADSHVAIAVGQNADDQCETILFRLLRGSGVDGLAGMAYSRPDEDGTPVIRPLLDVSREAIEAYCRAAGLTPRRDHTNAEPTYIRNRIRLELLPILRTYNAGIGDALRRLGAAAAEDREYFLEETLAAYEAALCAASPPTLSIEKLEGLHPAIRNRVYHMAVAAAGLTEDLTAAHLQGIERVRRSARPSARWSLPHGFVCRRAYDRLLFTREMPARDGAKAAEAFAEGVRASGSAALSGNTAAAGTAAVSTEKPSAAPAGGRLLAVFSEPALTAAHGQHVREAIVLRPPAAGDWLYIAVGGRLHRKKVQDILVDAKVPKDLRPRLLTAAVDSEILWILPVAREDGKTSVAPRLARINALGPNGRVTAAYRPAPAVLRETMRRLLHDAQAAPSPLSPAPGFAMRDSAAPAVSTVSAFSGAAPQALASCPAPGLSIYSGPAPAAPDAARSSTIILEYSLISW